MTVDTLRAASPVDRASSVADVVVGVDGSTAGDRALAWACAEAERRQLRLHVVHVWHRPLVATGPTTAAVVRELRRAARQHADYVLTKALKEAGRRVSATGTILEGTAGAALVSAADGADQLVVGDRGHGIASRAILGSTSSAVVQQRRTVITVVRGELGEDRGVVVVGVDGSVPSRTALARAAVEADARGARLVVIGAWQLTSPDLLDDFAGWRMPPQDELHRHATRRIEQAVRQTLPDAAGHRDPLRACQSGAGVARRRRRRRPAGPRHARSRRVRPDARRFGRPCLPAPLAGAGPGGPTRSVTARPGIVPGESDIGSCGCASVVAGRGRTGDRGRCDGLRRPERRRAPAGAALRRFAGDDMVVVGLPRGGVPVAFEVARALGAALDVIVVRKLGVPFQPELGMGAIGEDGVRIVNAEVVRRAGVSAEDLAVVEERERTELERRLTQLRGDRPRVPLTGRTVIVVDDGIATGSTARAACQVARAHGAEKVILAAPVGPPGIEAEMRPAADDVVCLRTPAHFGAIGPFYDDFTQLTDQEVLTLLRRSPAALAPRVDEEVTVDLTEVRLPGHLVVPPGADGVVVFAHGSGSSRRSPRNITVAAALNAVGLGTLLLDLLTTDEEQERANVFDIDLLGRRLTDAVRWLRNRPGLPRTRIGLFGASTGAAAALVAAADPALEVAAVVSRGGRPDLAGDRLDSVHAPTLLVVGGADETVLDLNRRAAARLRCPHRLEVVPGATHLFEEPGALDAVAHLSGEWFLAHLRPTG